MRIPQTTATIPNGAKISRRDQRRAIPTPTAQTSRMKVTTKF